MTGSAATRHFLYRWFDAEGRLLYVGITNDASRRVAEHVASKPWIGQAAQMTLTHYPDRAAVLAAEKEAIRMEQPAYNIVHNGGVNRAARRRALAPAIPAAPLGARMARALSQATAMALTSLAWAGLVALVLALVVLVLR